VDIYHRAEHRPDKRHIHHGADLGSAKVKGNDSKRILITDYGI